MAALNACLSLWLLCFATIANAFGCGNAPLLQTIGVSARSIPHSILLMQSRDPNRIGTTARKSGLSRNVPEEKLNRPRFIDEDDNAYGEFGTAMAKWQRTAGPIYIQLTGGGLFAAAFYNYFQLADSNGYSSGMWTVSIFTMFLGFALQRGDKDKQRPY